MISNLIVIWKQLKQTFQALKQFDSVYTHLHIARYTEQT